MKPEPTPKFLFSRILKISLCVQTDITPRTRKKQKANLNFMWLICCCTKW